MKQVDKTVCSNPWCKAIFAVMDVDVEVDNDGNAVYPRFCKKCVAQEESVTWENKHYDGDRWDGTPHQFTYKIKKFF